MDIKEFKNDFCFVTVSYNQEKYVFEHLESIKYIIENFGQGKKFQLIFSDDCSKDSTVDRARFWLDKNGSLFNEYKIVEHEENVGTIRNMIDATSSVDAMHFKEMACDDLYFKNNIFEICSNEKIVLTHPINFLDPDSIQSEFAVEYIVLLHQGNNIKKRISKMLAYKQCISSPGVLLPSFVWKNEGFKNYISQYKYIEDIPEWDYLFNKNDFNLKVETCGTPVVMYRRNVGTSENVKKTNNPIGDDYKNIRKNIKAKEDLLPKLINPYTYANFIKLRFFVLIYKSEAYVKEEIAKWKMDNQEAEVFLRYLKNKAKEVEKSYLL